MNRIIRNTTALGVDRRSLRATRSHSPALSGARDWASPLWKGHQLSLSCGHIEKVEVQQLSRIGRRSEDPW